MHKSKHINTHAQKTIPPLNYVIIRLAFKIKPQIPQLLWMRSKTFATSQLETTRSTQQVVISVYMRVRADASPSSLPVRLVTFTPVAGSEVIRRVWARCEVAVVRLGVSPRHENWICCTAGIWNGQGSVLLSKWSQISAGAHLWAAAAADVPVDMRWCTPWRSAAVHLLW